MEMVSKVMKIRGEFRLAPFRSKSSLKPIISSSTLRVTSRFRDMNKLMVTNLEKTMSAVDKVFVLEDVVKAYEYLEPQVHLGEIVICVAHDESGETLHQ